VECTERIKVAWIGPSFALVARAPEVECTERIKVAWIGPSFALVARAPEWSVQSGSKLHG